MAFFEKSHHLQLKLTATSLFKMNTHFYDVILLHNNFKNMVVADVFYRPTGFLVKQIQILIS